MVCFCKAGCGIQGEGTPQFSATWDKDSKSYSPRNHCHMKLRLRHRKEQKGIYWCCRITARIKLWASQDADLRKWKALLPLASYPFSNAFCCYCCLISAENKALEENQGGLFVLPSRMVNTFTLTWELLRRMWMVKYYFVKIGICRKTNAF